MKKWKLTNRLWHWINMVAIFGCLVTIWLEDVEVHVKVGFVLTGLFLFRVLYNLLGRDKQSVNRSREIIKKAFTIFREKRGHLNSREKYEVQKAGAKASYIGFALALVGIILTGLSMHFGAQLGLEESRHALKELHELCNILIIVFIVAHILGVVHAECTYEPNIVSDMINGGKEND